MPEESEPHGRTWMSFVASYDIWEDRQVPEVQKNLADIAKTIAKFEPLSILVRKKDFKLAEELLGGLNNHKYPIDLIPFELNDLWMRDTGPAFVINDNSEKAAINFNFNGWGEDQEYALDEKVDGFVTKLANVRGIRANLVLEGGCLSLMVKVQLL
ncbi:MAG: agmatine deiminase [Cocleimonas sp.]|jgi:agmatine deiminase